MKAFCAGWPSSGECRNTVEAGGTTRGSSYCTSCRAKRDDDLSGRNYRIVGGQGEPGVTVGGKRPGVIKTWSKDRFYQSSDWRRIRKAHLEQEPLCRACGSIGSVVDHCVPREVLKQAGHPDPDNEGNLQTLCFKCHQRKSQSDKKWHKKK